MGKINKFANLYDNEGKKIRSVNDKGILTDVSIEELEQMIDNYTGDKNSVELDNMKMALFALYRKYGNPHEQELIDRINEYAKTKTTSEMVTEKLNETVEDLQGDSDIDGDVSKNNSETVMDEYVDFQEVA